MQHMVTYSKQAIDQKEGIMTEQLEYLDDDYQYDDYDDYDDEYDPYWEDYYWDWYEDYERIYDMLDIESDDMMDDYDE